MMSQIYKYVYCNKEIFWCEKQESLRPYKDKGERQPNFPKATFMYRRL